MIIKNSLLKNSIFILSILILIFLVSLLIFKAYSGWEENSAINNQINNQKESKKKIIKTFKANKGIFEELVKNVYFKEEEIKINFSNENIQFIVNGKEEKLDEKNHSLLNRFYTVLKCENIRLYKNSSGNKVLEIYLGNTGDYSETIFYCKDKNQGFTDEIFPGWYYKAFWYT